jgi:hypothetical protein
MNEGAENGVKSSASSTSSSSSSEGDDDLPAHAAKKGHEKGTGELYVKSSGLKADGGDFDASKPGAGWEADSKSHQPIRCGPPTKAIRHL